MSKKAKKGGVKTSYEVQVNLTKTLATEEERDAFLREVGTYRIRLSEFDTIDVNCKRTVEITPSC